MLNDRVSACPVRQGLIRVPVVGVKAPEKSRETRIYNLSGFDRERL